MVVEEEIAATAVAAGEWVDAAEDEAVAVRLRWDEARRYAFSRERSPKRYPVCDTVFMGAWGIFLLAFSPRGPPKRFGKLRYQCCELLFHAVLDTVRAQLLASKAADNAGSTSHDARLRSGCRTQSSGGIREIREQIVGPSLYLATSNLP